MAEFRESRELEDFQLSGERKIRTEMRKEQTIKRGWQCGEETAEAAKLQPPC
ncbi:hypothetical protein HOLleu_09853 [Holothuria leucospilota]|uniref:Uncharacterized protein n=1 Tax=Holothuria leucospilota TaxID=206669 RepID=A0A9Q1CCR9_HOLLE|nr:hypothetical protein HOLleu_09853 [Holothuria leucospilota]